MIPDISLGIVFSLIFFGLGIVAFAYLAKGKN
jgi:1,4-dihydroxy-2-naphthoate octaprenyltransferase